MNHAKRILSALFPAIILVLLLSHPRLSADGAQKGLLLWFNTVFPTLFPFMLFSRLLAEHGGARLLLMPFRLMLRHLGMSVYGGYALLCGLLCGYPMGMKAAADFDRKGLLSAHEKRLLTAVSGSPSPMFVAGYIAPRLHPAVPAEYLAFSLYLPLLCIAVVLCLYDRIKFHPMSTQTPASSRFQPAFDAYKQLSEPNTSNNADNQLSESNTSNNADNQLGQANIPRQLDNKAASLIPASFDSILMDCMELQIRIGGLIMLYSIAAAFADAFCSGTLRFLLIGAAEMTTGIDAIARSGDFFSIPVQSGAMAACAAFGGLSGISQTHTVLKSRDKDREKNAGLSIRHYVLWKLVHANLTFVLFILLLHRTVPAQ